MNEKWYDLSPGWILLYEEAFLEGLARTLPEDSFIINIGSAVGTSSAAILRGVSHLDNVLVWSVDIKDCPEEIETLQEQGLLDETRFCQIQCDSGYIPHEEDNIDLVFIDGSHSYQGTLDDVWIFSQLLKPGGLLVCHDYRDPRQRDVTKAINAWKKENKWFIVGSCLYTIAFMKPGGDTEWCKGRVKYE